MGKWLSPLLLVLCAVFVLAQLGRAQESPQENSQAAVNMDSADPPAAVTTADSATATIPDPPEAAASSDPPPILSTSSPRAPSEWRTMGDQWKGIVPDLLRQQKGMWLFPFSVARGHHLKPTLAVIGATALLMTTDANDSRWVRNNLQGLHTFNTVFAGYNTATATEAFGSAFYLAAILRKNAYDQETFILGGEAVIDSEILTTVMKDVDGREAPISYPQGGDFTDSWFKVRHGNRAGWMGGLGSMPSGHEIAIMSVATLFAERYPHPVWHKWLAYGLAAAAGLSRITLQSHFTSDTFAGAALGYVITKYLVLGHQTSH